MRLARIGILLASLVMGSGMVPTDLRAQQVSVSLQLFYDELSPFGTWVDYPRQGYVWIPDGEPGFSPYATSGHWVFTEDGWTWISDYPWGWAPFHYGRWGFDDMYGWYWVPDDIWGPAWVTWRRSPGYYGWAPLRPGISITVALGGAYTERDDHWVFVRERNITHRDIGRQSIDRSRNLALIRSSTVIARTRTDRSRNATYVAGPERAEVQRVTRAPVTAVVIRDGSQPGQRLSDGELHLYRPRVVTQDERGSRPAPSSVKQLQSVRPVSERNASQHKRTLEPSKEPANDRRSGRTNVEPPNSTGRKQPQPTVAPAGKDRAPRSAPAPATRTAKKKKGERG